MEEETVAINPARNQRGIYIYSTSYDLFILVLTIFSLLVVAGLLLPLHPSAEAILLWVDFLLCVFFLFDFTVRLWRAPDRAGYFFQKGGWLDLLGSVPIVPGFSWTAIFRLARLNRFFRIIRRLKGEERDAFINDARENPARSALLSTIILAFLVATIASVLILRVERGAPGANITTGAIAFWWAIVTMTTVGYGDFVPVTHSGRIIAVALMTFGVGIFAVLTSFTASHLVVLRGDQDDLVALVREENAFIRAEIAELKTLLTQAGETDE
jgi:voltage-gated potassium channel